MEFLEGDPGATLHVLRWKLLRVELIHDAVHIHDRLSAVDAPSVIDYRTVRLQKGK
jgi:hypothetical protein